MSGKVAFVVVTIAIVLAFVSGFFVRGKIETNANPREVVVTNTRVVAGAFPHTPPSIGAPVDSSRYAALLEQYKKFASASPSNVRSDAGTISFSLANDELTNVYFLDYAPHAAPLRLRFTASAAWSYRSGFGAGVGVEYGAVRASALAFPFAGGDVVMEVGLRF